MDMSTQVVIEVTGGVATVTKKTCGVKVTLIDYDVEGEPESKLDKDKAGDPCLIMTYLPSEIV